MSEIVFEVKKKHKTLFTLHIYIIQCNVFSGENAWNTNHNKAIKNYDIKHARE